jgi:Protein of unknown function (DUF2752)
MKARVPLSAGQLRGRAACIASLVLLLALLRYADPVALGRVLPVRTSCGAFTGLPCLFCGMTRALHLMLRGDFARALYFNWLAFPVLGAILCVIGLFTLELWRRCILLPLRFDLAAPRLTTISLTLVALWILQAWLAVAQHKTELLNPRGPLYALFVRAR